jgi:hypothetical protein
MWYGFDPELRRQLETIKELTAQRFEIPTKEWPLIFVQEHDALLVVREWPNGEITAYITSEIRDTQKEQ